MAMQPILDRDAESRIFPGVSDASDLPADTAPSGVMLPEPASVDGGAHPPTVSDVDASERERRDLVKYITAYIGHESIGDPIPALVNHYVRAELGRELEPLWWHELWSGPLRVDMPQPGDLVRFQYQGTFPRFWHGVVIDVRDQSATVVLAQSLRDDAETELRSVDIAFKPMRGWQLNNAWPAVAFVRI